MSAPVKKCEVTPLEARCEVCLDTANKSQQMDGWLDCTACDAVERRLELRNYLGGLSPYMDAEQRAWAAYNFGMRRAAAAPVVPVAAQPVVPEGFQLVPTEINAVLAMGWAYLDAARENDPGQHYSFNHAGWRALLEKAKEYQPLAAPSLEAQPAGEVEREKLIDALAQSLTGSYDCMRVWSAWGVGTMSEDDFNPISDDRHRLEEIADELIAAMAQGEKHES